MEGKLWLHGGYMEGKRVATWRVNFLFGFRMPKPINTFFVHTELFGALQIFPILSRFADVHEMFTFVQQISRK